MPIPKDIPNHSLPMNFFDARRNNFFPEIPGAKLERDLNSKFHAAKVRTKPAMACP